MGWFKWIIEHCVIPGLNVAFGMVFCIVALAMSNWFEYSVPGSKKVIVAGLFGYCLKDPQDDCDECIEPEDQDLMNLGLPRILAIMAPIFYLISWTISLIFSTVMFHNKRMSIAVSAFAVLGNICSVSALSLMSQPTALSSDIDVAFATGAIMQLLGISFGLIGTTMFTQVAFVKGVPFPEL